MTTLDDDVCAAVEGRDVSPAASDATDAGDATDVGDAPDAPAVSSAAPAGGEARGPGDAGAVRDASDGDGAAGEAGDASDGDEAAGEAQAAPDGDEAAVRDRPSRPRLLPYPRLPRWSPGLPGSRWSRSTVAWAAAWTAAVALAAVAGWSYASVRGDDTLHFGKQRDAVLAAGQQDIARLTTADAGHADRDLGDWLAVTTGPLHDRLAGTHASDAATLKASGTSATGTVTDAAVTELDPRAGTAKVIATVQVRLRPASGAATTDRKRFEADLARNGGTWKLAALTAVPLGSS